MSQYTEPRFIASFEGLGSTAAAGNRTPVAGTAGKHATHYTTVPLIIIIIIIIIIILVDGSRVNQVTTVGVDKPDIPILAPSQIREYQAHAPQLDVCDLRQLEKIY